MESKAIAKFQRVSPRKTRLVAKNVQGKGVEEAMNILRFTPNKPSGVLLNVLKSAVANASQLGGVNVDAMVIKEVIVNEGPPGSASCPAPRAVPPRFTSVPATLPLYSQKGRNKSWVRKFIRTDSGLGITRTGSPAGSARKTTLPLCMKTTKSASM